MRIIIEEDAQGMLVREYIRTRLHFSRAMLSRLKQCADGILLNGAHVTVRAALRAGDELLLQCEDAAEDVNENLVPRALPLEILYEDADVVALNKGPGMPTHPSHDHFSDTLANALAYYYRDAGVPFVFRAVNRLDRDTSGVVLAAKNRPAAYRMSMQLQEGRVEKVYLAVVRGHLEGAGEIVADIRRAADSIILRQTCPDGEGAYACTRYRTLCSGERFSVAAVMPQTGLTHQIRVHFAHIGHPLIGDYLYGQEGECGMTRHALHACRMAFDDLRGGERVIVNAPVAPDIRALITQDFPHFFAERIPE